MSSDLRYQLSARRVPRQDPPPNPNVTVEGNLGKLGFIYDFTKKKSKSDTQGRFFGFGSRSSSSHHQRSGSRSSISSHILNPSSPPRSPSGKRMSSVLSDLDQSSSRSRKDKTFIGGECAVCEEQLELTLRGERILQLACSHIAHEACFYEYLRDFDGHDCPICNAPLSLHSNRGGIAPNMDVLSNPVRMGSSIRGGDYHQAPSLSSNQPAWDDVGAAAAAAAAAAAEGLISNRIPPNLTYRTSQHPSMSERSYQIQQTSDISSHHRQDSASSVRYAPSMSNSYQFPPSTSYNTTTTNNNPNNPNNTNNHNYNYHNHPDNLSGTLDHHLQSNNYALSPPQSEQSYAPVDVIDSQQAPSRKHDYDVQSMETAVNNTRTGLRNPIPAPTITLRSEFPTLKRARTQQSLTCLVTIEVPRFGYHQHSLNRGSVQGDASVATSERSGSLRSPRVASPVTVPSAQVPYQESPEDLDRITEELRGRVENWHGLDFSRFGQLRLHSYIRVGKDRRTWQDLDCYLFSDMLICVKQRKVDTSAEPRKPKCTLKGSILIKRHLKEVNVTPDENLLALTLSVEELPSFYLQFRDRAGMERWKGALMNLNEPAPPLNPVTVVKTQTPEYNYRQSYHEDDEYKTNPTLRLSSVHSSHGGTKSYNTAPTEYSSNHRNLGGDTPRPGSFHVPLDVIVVIPISSSMQGLKITLLRDALRFLVSTLGERDRMGLVTFGSSGGGVPLVGMTSRNWPGWQKTLENIRPVGQKSLRADVVEGANVAMDLLMQRKSSNPIASILLISDSSTSDPDSVDFVVQRAEAAKVTIHSFGLGLTHKPDTMIELSTRTKASYTYVKDWMMLRECIAGVFGSLQSTSHENVKLKLRLPEGSPAKFLKISGASHYTKRATGKDAEAALGDLRHGDKRDILVQLAIAPDSVAQEVVPHDPWETIVSGLEALSGNLDQDEQRITSIEEVPLLQADLVYGDLYKDGVVSQLARPSLLTITMLPAAQQLRSPTGQGPPRPTSLPIPPHPSVVQRRMELLTSDMLTRALTLVSRGQHDRAKHLLTETKNILKGLGKGGLPPIPGPGASAIPTLSSPPTRPLPTSPSATPTAPSDATFGAQKEKEKEKDKEREDDKENMKEKDDKEKQNGNGNGNGNGNVYENENEKNQAEKEKDNAQENEKDQSTAVGLALIEGKSTELPGPSVLSPVSPTMSTMTSATFPPNSPLPTVGPSSLAIDARTVQALETELESSLEWISHPAVFSRDARKGVLQAIGVISSQRAYTFRSPIEGLWAERIEGVCKISDKSREWREITNAHGFVGEGTAVMEES